MNDDFICQFVNIEKKILVLCQLQLNGLNERSYRTEFWPVKKVYDIRWGSKDTNVKEDMCAHKDGEIVYQILRYQGLHLSL